MYSKVNNYPNRTNVNFGVSIPIKKVIIDGQETKDLSEIRQVAIDYLEILLKRVENPNGKSIRRQTSKATKDYNTPQRRVSYYETYYKKPAVEMFIYDEDIKYITIGLEARQLLLNNYLLIMASYARRESRVADSYRDKISRLINSSIEIVTDPEVQLKGNKGLILYGTKVPKPSECVQTMTSRDTINKLTDVKFEVIV